MADATKVGFLVVNPEGKVPLVYEAGNDRLSLPKSDVEPGGDHEDVLHEGYEEETGLDPDQVVVASYAGTFIRRHVGLEEGHPTSYYLGRTSEVGRLSPRAAGIVSGHWVRLDSVRGVIQNPVDKMVVADNLPLLHAMAVDLGAGETRDAEA